MKLACPRCSCIIDVPDKAVLHWSEDCPGCRTKLYVATTDAGSNADDLIDFVLCEAPTEPKHQPADSANPAQERHSIEK